ncbi:MAG TPA: translation initiation factor IF-2 N-terminal domain-containing protein, partial [Acidimicrobiales bacterium]|nr:translation initiation factor IF-2 N-terminal domain-containing protein [Acidimicrobiales bacterium]
MPTKRIRVYELARELGLENKEALDLCLSLGIGVKSHSSSLEDQQADRVRRKADREGLRRAVAPEEDGKQPAAAPEPSEPRPATRPERLVRSQPTRPDAEAARTAPSRPTEPGP